MMVFEGTYDELKKRIATLPLDAQINIRVELIRPDDAPPVAVRSRQNSFLAANAIHGAYPRPKIAG
jgi:hypothetical protein